MIYKVVSGIKVAMTAEEEAEFLATLPVAKVTSVTMRQARRALHAAGLLSQVDSAIDALPEPDKTAARIEWEYSTEVQRSNATFITLTAALGLSTQQVDDLFTAAAAL